MPRRERTIPKQAIVASARNYTTGRSQSKLDSQRGRTAEEWMHAAWEFFDTIPEYHKGCVAVGALLSRAKLIVEERSPLGVWAPTENKQVLAVHDQLYGGADGQEELLRQLGIHFSVIGEGWIVAENNATSSDQWLVASPTDITKSAGGGWRINNQDFDGKPLVIRVWRPHARNRSKCDSPTRAILPVLSELLQLTKRGAAQIDSRLLGAGVLFVPSETSFAGTPTQVENQGETPGSGSSGIAPGDAQGLADALVEQARRAIANPEDPSSVIPLIAETPGEYIKEARLLNFWSELDKAAPAMRKEARERIATGMDIPPEVLLGGQGSNHWNMWLSDENSIKLHAEPTLKILVTSLSTGYLRPALVGLVPDPAQFRYASDTSQMRLRPNRSKEALELNDRLILSAQATARENGFTEADLMTPDERAEALLLKAAGGSATPEIVAAALKKAGVDLGVTITDNRPPTEARPTPSLRDHPARELPTQQSVNSANAAAMTALVYVSEQMVDRALQRAGNRLKTKMGLRSTGMSANRLYQTTAIAPDMVGDLLEDAWGSCDEFDYGVPGEDLARALGIYTSSLLISGKEPSRRGIAAALNVLLDSPRG